MVAAILVGQVTITVGRGSVAVDRSVAMVAARLAMAMVEALEEVAPKAQVMVGCLGEQQRRNACPRMETLT